MSFGLVLTEGAAMKATERPLQWLVEARVEMELSKPTRFALRFEDDICEGKREMAESKSFAKDQLLGLFVKAPGGSLECLVFGPVTRLKASSMLGGPGSWVEVHGEDRRNLMGRVPVLGAYQGKASKTAELILKRYGFKAVKTEPTRIDHGDKGTKQHTQRGTDLQFVEEIARRNNLEFWLDYETRKNGEAIVLDETANLRTSPPRGPAGGKPELPVLVPDKEDRVLRVDPPPGQCPNLNKFEARIDFEKPAAAQGFAMTPTRDKALVAELVSQVEPVDPEKPLAIAKLDRKPFPDPEPLDEERRLAMEGTVLERSWFVEVDCSATLEQLGFLVRPHQNVRVAHAGAGLHGAYQVMKAVHVVTASDHYMDFTIRANGLGGEPA